jgi:hypothetical protein
MISVDEITLGLITADHPELADSGVTTQEGNSKCRWRVQFAGSVAA